MVLDPPSCFDEVAGVSRMFGHAGSYGEHVGVEDNVFWRESGLLGQQVVHALADCDAALVVGGLTLFVEAHSDDGST